MKKNTSFFSALFFLVIIASGEPFNAKGQDPNKWNGTVRFYQITTGGGQTLEERMDAVITNDTGSAVHSFYGQLGEGCIADCKTADQTELELGIDIELKEYGIRVPVPGCVGTTLCKGITRSYAQSDATAIMIEGQPLGANHNVLSGTFTETFGPDRTGLKVVSTFTWALVKGPIDAELIVTPSNYDNWLPEPGIDESTTGSVINILLKVQGKNGRPLSAKTKAFELRLSNTSRETGITLNAPKNPSANQLPDLRFLTQADASVSEEDQLIKIPCHDDSTGKVTIGSFDGGGWTTLTAIAILEDGTQIKGSLLVSGGEQEIRIPKRDVVSKIATAWLSANGNPGEMEDKETSKGNPNNGDGFTAYEEYRGFMSEGQFKRLDPQKKQLAVRVKTSELPVLSEGLSWFENASDIKVVRFLIFEVANDRRINFNSGHAHNYDQYALKVEKGNLSGNMAGKAFTASGKPDIPKNTTQVIIATNNISQNYQNWSNLARSNGLQLPWTEKEYVAQTVAHEIGHGVNVSHHGDDTNTPQGETAQQGGIPPYHIFDRNALEIANRPYTINKNDRVCSPGTQASGDLGCVMAYIDVCEWARIPYADGSIGLFQSPLLPIGRNFCISNEGTSINAGLHNVNGVPYPNYFGEAAKGNCLDQIKLK